jgi:putative transposase
VQRGNNRQAVVYDDNDYRVYLDWLGEAAAAHGCAIHAYVLMTNHIHLLMTPADVHGISATLQAIGRRFVPYINHCYGRTGTLWEGRFRASTVEEERYLLVCYRYIELNPERAGIVDLPADYPWSSYRVNALGEPSPLVSPHPAYLALGADGSERQAAYRELFTAHIGPEMLGDVRACLQSGTPLGNDRFRLQIEQALGVKVGYSTRGRPKSPPVVPSQDVDQTDLDL